jgi:hypothetical protein
MKRLNPATNLPFKKGDVREDGYIFFQYRKIIKPYTKGYYVEYWLKPKVFKRHNFTDRSGSERTAEALATNILSNAYSRCNGIPSRIASGRVPTNGIVTINHKWLVEKIKRGICEATGDKITTQSSQSNTASLDRIDPCNPDYTPENARIVTWQFNNMKGTYTDEEFIRVAEALKNVKQNKLTPVPEGPDSEGQDDTTHRATNGPRTWEIGDSANDHRGEPEGEDAHRGTEEGSGVGVGAGVAEVESFEGYESLKMYGFTDDEIRCVIQAVGDHDSQPREPSVAP